MRSEELICAAASAAGIDLQQAVRRQKHGVASTVLLEPPKRGKASHLTQRPRWTLAELQQASQGVPTIPVQAARYAYAGEDSKYWQLHAALLAHAVHLARQHRWPDTVIDVHGIKQPYLAHLAVTVLDADRHAARFNAFPALYAVWMRVSERIWERDLEERFWLLHDQWDSWTGQAVRMIQAKLQAPG